MNVWIFYQHTTTRKALEAAQCNKHDLLASEKS